MPCISNLTSEYAVNITLNPLVCIGQAFGKQAIVSNLQSLWSKPSKFHFSLHDASVVYATSFCKSYFYFFIKHIQLAFYKKCQHNERDSLTIDTTTVLGINYRLGPSMYTLSLLILCHSMCSECALQQSLCCKPNAGQSDQTASTCDYRHGIR